ncbi:MAG: riboflavin synthase [Anaerovoracaceae bacterium]|nr:riboflavin synthase [Anaerovoracaceae bacterium]
MFTGIIEEIGIIQAVHHGPASSLLTIRAEKVLEDVKDGDSIAVNGVCLTVTSHGSSYFTADVMHETLNRSSLGNLRQGSPVNLERAMAAGSRFGGHIVSGHIDGIGTVSAIRQDDIAVWYTISASPSILRYIIEKGSIAIDGISLTVATVTDIDFSVSIIPHTAAQTTLSRRKSGDIVNLENDVIGKYVEKLLQPAVTTPKTEASSITMDFIEKYGF